MALKTKAAQKRFGPKTESTTKTTKATKTTKRLAGARTAVKTKARIKAAPVPTVVGGTPILQPSFREIPARAIFPSPLNPRRHIDDAALDELAASIVANGLLQPILVRPLRNYEDHIKGEAFEIICGERRIRAICRGIADGHLPKDYSLPVRIRDCSDEELVRLAATENLARKDMQPLEEAAVFDALRKVITHAEGEKPETAVARALGTSERTVWRRLALLKLAPELQEDLREGKITNAQAAAFSLGEIETQLKHRKSMAGNEWHRDEVTIRRHMTEKRVPVERAAFDVATYAGELIEDPETGKRYFADRADFDIAQTAAIDARTAILRGEWKWVKKIDHYMSASYAKVKKTDAAAGAVYWVDHQGVFCSKAPVIKPEEVQKRAEQARKDRGAGAEHSNDSYEAKNHRRSEARRPLVDAAATRPAAALALAILQLFTQGVDHYGDENPAAEAALTRALAPLAIGLGLTIGLPDDEDLLDALANLDDGQEAKVFRYLVALPTMSTLLPLWAACSAQSLSRPLVDYDKAEPNLLGQAFAEPGLFEAEAEAAQ